MPFLAKRLTCVCTSILGCGAVCQIFWNGRYKVCDILVAISIAMPTLMALRELQGASLMNRAVRALVQV